MGAISTRANTITLADDSSPTPISPRTTQTTVDATTTAPTELASAPLSAETALQSLPATQPFTAQSSANPFVTTLDDNLTRFDPGDSTQPNSAITPTAIPLPLPWEAAGVGLVGVIVISLARKPQFPRVMRLRNNAQSWG